MTRARTCCLIGSLAVVALFAPSLAVPAVCNADIDTTWHERSGERWLDASACDAPRGAALLRCVERGVGPALGVCGDLRGDNTLVIDRRTSSTLALAVDGETRVSSPFSIAGDFVEATALRCPNTLDVAGDLFVHDAWTVSSPAHVTGDAYLARLDAINTVRIDGTLHLPSSQPLASDVSAGAMARGGVVVRSALDCAHALRASSLVGQARARGSLLPADTLEHVVETSHLTLGCGTFVLSSVAVDAALTIHVRGRVVLAIERDVRIHGPVTIDVAPGAELDLLIGGSLAVDNILDVRASEPAAVWMAVGGDARVGSPMRLVGRLAMPEGSLAADNTLEVWGAVLAHDVRIGSPLIVHDGASLSARGCAVDRATTR